VTLSGIGPSELIILVVIGLLILGPERLPRVASQIGRWVGKARRTANQLRYQLEREVALADIEKNKKKDPTARPNEDIAGSRDASGTDGAETPAPADGAAPDAVSSAGPAADTPGAPGAVADGAANESVRPAAGDDKKPG
jgi:sec-independent protein translocase protein TatB